MIESRFQPISMEATIESANVQYTTEREIIEMLYKESPMAFPHGESVFMRGKDVSLTGLGGSLNSALEQ